MYRKPFTCLQNINAGLLRDLTLGVSHDNYRKEICIDLRLQLQFFSRGLKFRGLRFRGLSFRGLSFRGLSFQDTPKNASLVTLNTPVLVTILYRPYRYVRRQRVRVFSTVLIRNSYCTILAISVSSREVFSTLVLNWVCFSEEAILLIKQTNCL